MNFAENSLVGTVPFGLIKLPYLEEINLSNNKLTRTVPADLGEFSRVTFLNFSNNLFAGSLSEKLASMGDRNVTILLEGNSYVFVKRAYVLFTVVSIYYTQNSQVLFTNHSPSCL